MGTHRIDIALKCRKSARDLVQGWDGATNRPMARKRSLRLGETAPLIGGDRLASKGVPLSAIKHGEFRVPEPPGRQPDGDAESAVKYQEP